MFRKSLTELMLSLSVSLIVLAAILLISAGLFPVFRIVFPLFIAPILGSIARDLFLEAKNIWELKRIVKE